MATAAEAGVRTRTQKETVTKSTDPIAVLILLVCSAPSLCSHLTECDKLFVVLLMTGPQGLGRILQGHFFFFLRFWGLNSGPTP
jgi:hypothetical protein